MQTTPPERNLTMDENPKLTNKEREVLVALLAIGGTTNGTRESHWRITRGNPSRSAALGSLVKKGLVDTEGLAIWITAYGEEVLG